MVQAAVKSLCPAGGKIKVRVRMMEKEGRDCETLLSLSLVSSVGIIHHSSLPLSLSLSLCSLPYITV
jgi:hypothetical protein